MKSLPKWAGVVSFLASISAVAEGPTVTAWLNAHGLPGQIGLIVIVAFFGVIKLLAHSLPGKGGK